MTGLNLTNSQLRMQQQLVARNASAKKTKETKETEETKGAEKIKETEETKGAEKTKETEGTSGTNARSNAPEKNFCNIPFYKYEATKNGATATKTINNQGKNKYNTKEEALAHYERDLTDGLYKDAMKDLGSDGFLDDKIGNDDYYVSWYTLPYMISNNQSGTKNSVNMGKIEYDVTNYDAVQDENGKWYVTGTVKMTVTYDLTRTVEWEVGDRYMDESGYLFEFQGIVNSGNYWIDMGFPGNGHTTGDITEYNGKEYKLQKDGTWKEIVHEPISGDHHKFPDATQTTGRYEAEVSKDLTLAYNNIKFTQATANQKRILREF